MAKQKFPVSFGCFLSFQIFLWNGFGVESCRFLLARKLNNTPTSTTLPLERKNAIMVVLKTALNDSIFQKTEPPNPVVYKNAPLSKLLMRASIKSAVKRSIFIYYRVRGFVCLF